MAERDALFSSVRGAINSDVPNSGLVVVVAQRIVLSVAPLQGVRTGGQRKVERLTANRVVKQDARFFVDSEVKSVVEGLRVDSTDKRDPTLANKLQNNGRVKSCA